MSVNVFSVEVLESRTLMSASADPTAKLDRLQIRVDLLKFRADAPAGTAAILSDRIALKGDNLAAATTVTPLIATLKSDAKAMRLALKIDRLTEASAALADQSVIVGDLKQILIDRKDPTVLAADRAKLHDDRMKLQTDLIAGLDSRIATRQSYHDTLFNDAEAIVPAVQSDPNASDKLKTDVQTFVTDFESKLGKMETDLQKVEADRTKLVSDLNA